MSKKERHILQHALGISNGGKEYRNHFVAGEGSTDYPHCESLVEKGYMTRRDGSPLTGGDYVYFVTDAGRQALKEQPHDQH